MNSWRSLIIATSIGLSFWLFGHILPKKLEANPPLPLPQFPLVGKKILEPIDTKQIELDQPVISENELLLLLENNILPIKVSRSGKTSTFQFGQGLPLYTHLSDTKEILDSLNCPIVDGIETKEHNDVEIEYRCSSRWTGHLRFVQSSSDHQIFSQLSIVLTVDSALDISLLNQLNKSTFPYTLLINPFNFIKEGDFDLDRLSNKEVMLQIPMEPTGYPFKNPGPNTLLINHKKEQLQSILSLALKRFPKTRAVAPEYGDRAVNHPSFMITFLEILATERLSYLDLHNNGKSDRRTWCHQVGVNCFNASYKNKNTSLMSEIERAVGNAKKNGKNILLLEADTTLIKIIEQNKEAWIEEGLELVLFSELAETEINP